MAICLLLTIVASPLSIVSAYGDEDESGYSSDSASESSSEEDTDTVKILFSNKSIVDSTDTNQFTDKFTANSNIYAIAYLPEPIQSIAPNSSTLNPQNATTFATAWVSVDGSHFCIIEDIDMDIKDYQANKNYFTFEILPNPKSTKGNSLDKWYKSFLSELKPGNHTVEIKLWINEFPVTSGEFNLDWTNADKNKILKNIKECEKSAQDYNASMVKVPDAFKQKHKAYKDPELSDKKIKALFMKTFTDATKILKFVNIGDNSTSWTIEKNELDIPVAKNSTMATWVIYKTKDGSCYITQFDLKRTYTGGGTYGKVFISNSYQGTKIAEKNVK